MWRNHKLNIRRRSNRERNMKWQKIIKNHHIKYLTRNLNRKCSRCKTNNITHFKFKYVKKESKMPYRRYEDYRYSYSCNECILEEEI